MAKMLIKYKEKPSALLTLRPCAECFASRKANARKSFNEFPEIKMCLLVYCNLCKW